MDEPVPTVVVAVDCRNIVVVVVVVLVVSIAAVLGRCSAMTKKDLLFARTLVVSRGPIGYGGYPRNRLCEICKGHLLPVRQASMNDREERRTHIQSEPGSPQHKDQSDSRLISPLPVSLPAVLFLWHSLVPFFFIRPCCSRNNTVTGKKPTTSG